jgi:hypothetical protein
MHSRLGAFANAGATAPAQAHVSSPTPSAAHARIVKVILQGVLQAAVGAVIACLHMKARMLTVHYCLSNNGYRQLLTAKSVC